MLRDGSISYEAGGWGANVEANVKLREWKRVDEQLRELATQFVSLEAELARWLREAQRVKVWKYAGCVTMNEYLERVFGSLRVRRATACS